MLHCGNQIIQPFSYDFRPQGFSVSDTMKVWNGWFKLSVQATQLASQNVVALRLMKIAADGQRGHSEGQRMVTEKIVVAVEAQAAGAAAACAGGDGTESRKRSWAS
jgi:hypothetical protein